MLNLQVVVMKQLLAPFAGKEITNVAFDEENGLGKVTFDCEGKTWSLDLDMVSFEPELDALEPDTEDAPNEEEN